MTQPTITFESGADEVTGVTIRLSLDGKNMLIDCGLIQGGPDSSEKNHRRFPYNPSEIDLVFVTHAHLDHIGRIPKLVRDGFQGTIYSTPVTKEVSGIMFDDALSVMAHEEREHGTEPLYNMADVTEALNRWETVEYHERTRFFEDLVTLELRDAGHIIGSASVSLTVSSSTGGEGGSKKTIAFVHDLGNSPAPLLREPDVLTDADYLVIDSVYGDRVHETPKDRDETFRRIVKESIERGGTLMIPAFSLARTQIILHELNSMVGEGVIQSAPVFLDSPLAIKLTHIYEKLFRQYNKETQREIKEEKDGNIFSFPNLTLTERVPESKAIEDSPSPKIVIAGSGMSTGGRILHHEADYLPDENSTLLLVGYQAHGTLGRQLEEGATEVEIFGKTFPVRARVEKIEGYSSHADADQLVSFITSSADSLQTVFLAMGDPDARGALKERLERELSINVVAPHQGDAYTLD